MRFLKNLKGYEFSCLIIIVLLFVQAMCDLSLPNYTADLLDTGIQNSGIEYGVPEKISKDSFDSIKMIMTKDEASKWAQAYEQKSDFLKLTDTARDNIEVLEKDFLIPITCTYFISQSQVENTEKAKLEMLEQMEDMGESMLHSSAIAFVAAEYKKIGIDLNEIQSAYLWKTGARMLGMAFLMMIVAIIVGFFAAKVAAAIGKDLREKIFAKVVNFSEAEMKKFSTASLITRSTNDVQQVQQVTVMLLRMVVYAPILAVGGIIMVVRTGSGMEWIIALAVAAILILVSVLLIVAMPKFKIMQKKVDDVNLIAREILTGISVIRAFTREKYEEERFDRANTELTKIMLFTNRTMTFMMPFMMLIMNGISILIVWIGAHRINVGVLEVGTMTAFITYTMQIVMSFLMLTMMSIMLPRAAVASDRIKEIINEENTVCDSVTAKALLKTKGIIRFENVSFSYPGAENCVLSNINFTAQPGKTTAIIGSTGSGKSTLVQLLLRFYDVTEGKITIDGENIRNIKQQDLREHIGYVPQNGILFSGTIESNICYGNKNLSAEAMAEVAEIAQVREFIEAKNEKYGSFVAQGGNNVSGGQKQRLSIARAVAKNPKIYIFDDSFSALDFKTDAALREALAAKTKESTVFIVAQRIGTILNAEQIVVLDEGKVAGIGTHSELMQSCEVYRQIAESQLSLDEIDNNLGYSKKESVHYE